jgi:hypothetical protein
MRASVRSMCRGATKLLIWFPCLVSRRLISAMSIPLCPRPPRIARRWTRTRLSGSFGIRRVRVGRPSNSLSRRADATGAPRAFASIQSRRGVRARRLISWRRCEVAPVSWTSGHCVRFDLGGRPADRASRALSRPPGRRQHVLDLEHYLDVLIHKPGAFAGSKPLAQWRAAGRRVVGLPVTTRLGSAAELWTRHGKQNAPALWWRFWRWELSLAMTDCARPLLLRCRMAPATSRRCGTADRGRHPQRLTVLPAEVVADRTLAERNRPVSTAWKQVAAGV